MLVLEHLDICLLELSSVSYKASQVGASLNETIGYDEPLAVDPVLETLAESQNLRG